MEEQPRLIFSIPNVMKADVDRSWKYCFTTIFSAYTIRPNLALSIFTGVQGLASGNIQMGTKMFPWC